MAGKKGRSGAVKTIARLEVEKYCREFKDTPDLTLAKKIYKDHPKLFKNVDAVRSYVRIVRGHRGEYNRINSTDKSLFKPLTYNTNPFKLPESHSVKQEVFKLPKSIRKVLLLSDIHFPYHDVDALTAALQYGIDQKVDAVYLNGDIMDFYQLSFHEKDPRKTDIGTELEMCRSFFAELRKNFSCPIYFISGNHELRLERYLRVKAAELLGLDEFRLDVLLRMGEHKIINLKHGTKVYFGKLLVEHGDKMKGAGGVNPARTLLLRFKRPSICGHFHRTSSANSKVYDDDSMMAWTTGCLCELEPSYMELNEHNHGFAIVNVNPDDTFNVENKMIINGKVY